jgi:hypothetical protein
MQRRDATVMTPAHDRVLACRSSTAPPLRQFIEAGPEQDRLRRLVIGLSVTQIDAPVLPKIIIMVRPSCRRGLCRTCSGSRSPIH